MFPSSSRFAPLVRPLTTGLAVASTAASGSAAVIYNNTPLSFTGGNNSYTSTGFSLDGGTDDFSAALFTGKDASPYFTQPSTFSITPVNGNQVTTGELTFGDPINGTSSFGAGPFSVPIDGANHFVGFVLNPGGAPLYGWLSVMHIGGNGDGNGKVNSWAYDDSGAGITAGQTTAIPEPASAAAVAALLAGSAAVWKRRRQKFEAAVIAA
jgi:hypothetical protein